jgi:Raf kinase inhibitor-like YbhB/YbcL family protein
MMRTVIVVALALALSGCRGKTDAAPAPQSHASSGGMTLTSSAFANGAAIPKQFTCDGVNVSPPLAWSGPPSGAKSFVLIVHDPDAPAGDFTHWLLFNIPGSVTQLQEDGAQKQGDNGRNSYGKLFYSGPCPPAGTHHYVFHFYALDSELDLRPGATRPELEQAIKGHILAEAELTGTYSR